MAHFIGIAAALLILGILSLAVGSLVEIASKGYREQMSNIDDPDFNDSVLTGHGNGGRIVGWLEMIISLLAFWINAPLLIGGWLAFKVASKWQTWRDIIQVPEAIEGIELRQWFLYRKQWGNLLYVRFLVGTGSNIISGFLASYIGQLIISRLN